MFLLPQRASWVQLSTVHPESHSANTFRHSSPTSLAWWGKLWTFTVSWQAHYRSSEVLNQTLKSTNGSLPSAFTCLAQPLLDSLHGRLHSGSISTLRDLNRTHQTTARKVQKIKNSFQVWGRRMGHQKLIRNCHRGSRGPSVPDWTLL